MDESGDHCSPLIFLYTDAMRVGLEARILWWLHNGKSFSCKVDPVFVRQTDDGAGTHSGARLRSIHDRKERSGRWLRDHGALWQKKNLHECLIQHQVDQLFGGQGALWTDVSQGFQKAWARFRCARV